MDHSEQTEAIKRLTEELKNTIDLLNSRNNEIARLNEKISGYEKTIDGLRQINNKVFSILSHDLRSPFNGLLGFTNFLSNDIESFSNDQIKMFADNISVSARALLELIDDLFNWARLERGDTTYKPMDIELNYIISEVFYLIRAHADSKKISLLNNVKKDTYVYADLYMTKTVMQNLIYNAIKFTNTGGEVQVNTGSSLEGDIVISIEDNGIGISRNNLEKLFQLNSFYTTRGTANEKGSGLGLILCRELLRRNNGKISVESEAGKGSTFYVTLPKGKNKTKMINQMVESA
jgi:signal transduction histidine kinase